VRERALVAEAAEHLVGADVHEAELRAGVAVELGAVAARRLQHDGGALEVGAHEGHRTVDAAIDVALGGQVQDARGPVGLEQVADGVRVGDVALDEDHARVVGQVVATARVGERVEHDDEALGAHEQLAHHRAADEAGAAGDEGGAGSMAVGHGVIVRDRRNGRPAGRPLARVRRRSAGPGAEARPPRAPRGGVQHHVVGQCHGGLGLQGRPYAG
jgi:hypothetical protein